MAATALIKLPAMLVDIVVGWLLYRLVLGWTWPSRRAETLALGAAALYVFNPVTWYDSALWGQTDAVGALVVLPGGRAHRGNSEGAALLGVLAALVKPQFGVVLIPLVAVPPAAPAPVPDRLGTPPRALGARTAAWLAGTGAGAAARHLGAGWRCSRSTSSRRPFGLGTPEYLDLMARTASGYAYLTVNAYNLWALVGLDGQHRARLGDALLVAGPRAPGGTGHGVRIGALLLIAGFLYGLVRVPARDRWTIVVTAAFLCMAFFVLPTRVHERYLFAAVFAFLPLLAVTSRCVARGLVGARRGVPREPPRRC